MQFVLAARSAVGFVLNQITGLAKALKFNAATASFTAGMAKRLPPTGPFAAVLLVQGQASGYSSASDVLAIAPGTAIKTFFYPNFDEYQGTVVFWITPEWNGNDGLRHQIFTEAAYGSPSLQKTTGSNLSFNVGGSTLISASVAAWVAGTTYCVVIRWDSKNTLDGTNYMCISINDVHTLGASSCVLANGISVLNFYGDCILQGLTIYRRPLFDGAYGCDVGNGDEINLIYNAAAGTDPTEITGSFDVCLCVPTNATPGALTTGSADAWSHPHGSELLTDAFCQTAYASSAWADVGTPVTPVSVQYNGTSTVTNAGTEGTVDNLPTADFTAELWLRPDRVNSNNDYLLFKNVDATHQWYLRLNASAQLNFYCYFGTTAINYVIAHGMKAGQWSHIVLSYNATTKTGSIAVGGIWLGTSAAGSGTYGADAAADLLLGNNNSTAWLSAAMGWLRISNVYTRYTVGTNFTPPPRGICPANDANTVRLFPMSEGAGTTITDLSTNAQNGTLSNGTRNTTRDMATEAPGERVYQWGYDFAADAANEGITQTLSGQAAGTDMVIRPVLHYTPEAIPKVQVLDATNGDAVITSMTLPNLTANLVVNGGFDANTGSWTASLSTLYSEAGGISGNCLKIENLGDNYGSARQTIQGAPYASYRITYWHKGSAPTGLFRIGSAAENLDLYQADAISDAAWTQRTGIFKTSATGLIYLTLGIYGNTNLNTTFFDSITLTRIIDSKRPWCEPFSFELPTVARNGVAADCTSIKVQVIDTAGLGGVTSVHQVELLNNLIDNPTFAVGSGDPWVPSGWSNSGGLSGEILEDTTEYHSGGRSMKLVGLGAHYTFVSAPLTVAVGRFIYVGSWLKSTSVGRGFIESNVQVKRQSSNAGWDAQFTVNWAAWKLHHRMGRVAIANPSLSYLAYNTNNQSQDDLYAIALDPVTLTCTPASTANSQETSGLRVDGRDTLSQAVTAVDGIFATSGTIKFRYTPRHSAAVAAKFGELTPYLCHLWGNATDYAALYWSAANTLKLEFNANGAGVQSGTWDATGVIVAGTTYAIEIAYTATTMTLKVDDVTKITVTQAVNFGTVPTTIYWGHKQDSTCVSDAAYAAPL
jgi:hypothetical protein